MAPWLMFFAGMFVGTVLILPTYLVVKHIRRVLVIRDYEKPCPCGGNHTKGEGRLSPIFCNRPRLPHSELMELDRGE